MTTKEAAKKFSLSEWEVRKLAKEKKIIGADKINGVHNIPEDAFIITDKMARAFLLKILKLKNNPHEVISTNDLIDQSNAYTWHIYMHKQGLVGDCAFVAEPRQLLQNMQLTDKGWAFALGAKTFSLLKFENVNINLQVSAISVSAVGIGA